MKGKIAFVLGAAVGYVLGTRAGRARYEQIKRGARRVWRSDPVQRGVTAVQDVVGDRAEDLKGFALRVGSELLDEFGGRGRASGTAESAAGAKPDDSTEPSDATPPAGGGKPRRRTTGGADA